MANAPLQFSELHSRQPSSPRALEGMDGQPRSSLHLRVMGLVQLEPGTVPAMPCAPCAPSCPPLWASLSSLRLARGHCSGSTASGVGINPPISTLQTHHAWGTRIPAHHEHPWLCASETAPSAAGPRGCSIPGWGESQHSPLQEKSWQEQTVSPSQFASLLPRPFLPQ